MSTPVIQLSGGSPISSVALVDTPRPTVQTPVAQPASSDAEIRRFRQAAAALEQAAQDIQDFSRQLFSSHREQLIRLSIEIAAKVLAKDIHQRNYEIEKIISQALEEVPQGRPVTVKLNPEDLKTYQKVLGQKDGPAPPHIHLAADGTVGPGQCIIETEQGVIEWIIEEHLKRISDALLSSSPKP
jgi:flagellar biosynthesis/type III secretory pathway protein FliH